MLRRLLLSSLCALLLLLTGCPKRQEQQSELVYIPAPKPASAQVAATSPAASQPQVLVIEEPPPPPQPEPEQEEEAPAPQTPEPASKHKPKHTNHPDAATDQQDETASPAEETPETPPPAVPALEPRQSSAEESEQKREFLGLQQDLGKRLEKLSNAHLSANDQKALEDARTFFTQANQAMANGDVSRALNLAHKAGLLLSALE